MQMVNIPNLPHFQPIDILQGSFVYISSSPTNLFHQVWKSVFARYLCVLVCTWLNLELF